MSIYLPAANFSELDSRGLDPGVHAAPQNGAVPKPYDRAAETPAERVRGLKGHGSLSGHGGGGKPAHPPEG